MYARVNAATGSKLLQESACGFELGFDFCQIFTFAQHSTGCLFLRCSGPAPACFGIIISTSWRAVAAMQMSAAGNKGPVLLWAEVCVCVKSPAACHAVHQHIPQQNLQACQLPACDRCSAAVCQAVQPSLDTAGSARRSTAVMEEDKGKSRWIKLLLVIPGKSEPKKMSPYVRFLIKDLQDFGPSGASGSIVCCVSG